LRVERHGGLGTPLALWVKVTLVAEVMQGIV
jgi:hypothetical protein